MRDSDASTKTESSRRDKGERVYRSSIAAGAVTLGALAPLTLKYVDPIERLVLTALAALFGAVIGGIFGPLARERSSARDSHARKLARLDCYRRQLEAPGPRGSNEELRTLVRGGRWRPYSCRPFVYTLSVLLFLPLFIFVQSGYQSHGFISVVVGFMVFLIVVSGLRSRPLCPPKADTRASMPRMALVGLPDFRGHQRFGRFGHVSDLS